jgi:predicted dienelactone hydrolase
MQDIRTTIDEVTRNPRIGTRIDSSKIGAAGHSLGGYTVLGLAGGWASWKDERIKAAVLMSPYVAPYLVAGTLPSIHIPLMYQGGTRDNRVTPEVRKKAGAYDMSNSPKYYVEFEGARHLDWSNMTCSSRKFIPDCAAEATQARLIIAYATAFFDRYLKGASRPLLERPGARVADYRHVD